jgi:hypothetical protein
MDLASEGHNTPATATTQISIFQADWPPVNTIARMQATRISVATGVELAQEWCPVAVAERPEVDYVDVFQRESAVTYTGLPSKRKTGVHNVAISKSRS